MVLTSFNLIFYPPARITRSFWAAKSEAEKKNKETTEIGFFADPFFEFY